MDRLQLFSDQAIGEGENKREDGLDFKRYATILSDTAINTPGPFNIGVFGEWGTGKTSLLKLIQRDIDQKSPNIITVWFNAWLFEKEEHPIIPLIATIINEIEANKTFFAKLDDKGKAFLHYLKAVAYGFSLKSKLSLPEFIEIEASIDGSKIIDKIEDQKTDPLFSINLYYKAYEKLTAFANETNCKIVVIIDDLDRCFPDKAIKLLESIKLVLSQKNFVFFLGIARSVIEGYLRIKYQKNYGIENFAGQTYLDKMIQLSFYIPPHTKRITKFSSSLVSLLPEEYRKELGSIIPNIGATCGNNPRNTIRFLNNLLIDHAINKELSKDHSVEIIPLGYFAITRSLQQIWINIYNLLVANDDLCEEISTWEIQDLFSKEIHTKQRNVEIAIILAANIDVCDILFSETGRKWLNNSSLRNSAINFLTMERRETITNLNNKLQIQLVHLENDLQYAIETSKILQSHGIRYTFKKIERTDQNIENTITNSTQGNHSIIFVCSFISKNKSLINKLIQNLYFSSNNDFQLYLILLPGSNSALFPNILLNFKCFDLTNLEGISENSLKPLINQFSSNFN